MLDNLPYTIKVEDQDIIVKLNRGVIDQETLLGFLDYLELETIRKRSLLTEEQATTLAEEIDHSVWSDLKHKSTGA